MATQRIDIGGASSGITVEYVKSRQILHLHGHYDGFVGIEGEVFALGDFLRRLGITLKDCTKALGT